MAETGPGDVSLIDSRNANSGVRKPGTAVCCRSIREIVIGCAMKSAHFGRWANRLRQPLSLCKPAIFLNCCGSTERDKHQLMIIEHGSLRVLKLAVVAIVWPIRRADTESRHGGLTPCRSPAVFECATSAFQKICGVNGMFIVCGWDFVCRLRTVLFS